jgi:hypothetical protein
MVRENTSTVEVTESYVADVVGEDIHFNEDTVAVYGNFNRDDRTADKGLFEAALTLIEGGAESVNLGDLEIVRTHDNVSYGEDYGTTEIVEVLCEGGPRSTSIGELRAALEKSKSLES